MLKNVAFLIVLWISSIECWEALPEIPSGRRSQYLVLHENGNYKYGYDTGDGSAAEQSADAANQVEGRYLYDSPSGQKFSIKYTAGIQGFIPEGLPTVSPSIPEVSSSPLSRQYLTPETSDDGQSGTGDASYSFNVDTDTYRRQETSDSRGNIKGRYSYNNEAGTHDLSYTAGENTGFVALSGSLATPNGLEGSSSIPPSSGYTYNPSITSSSGIPPSPSGTSGTDGSYSFGYSTQDASQQQSGDANGNVKGSYSYRNSAGVHDLSYTAGSDTGFVATGGSLSQPNGLGSQIVPSVSGNSQATPDIRSQGDGSLPNADGSYSFGYSTPDASQQQSADAEGNVKGSYSYRNSAGIHDLSYIAGSGTGFVATGGSLSQPNGLGSQIGYAKINSQVTGISSLSAPSISSSPSTDGSYRFDYSTDDSARRETSDGNGNVQGSYSYRNQAGNHDLSYVAGSSTGFQVRGGSLSVPNGLGSNNPSSSLKYNMPETPTPVDTYSSSEGDLANTGDASYSFNIDTDTYKRTETSDASGNVQGSYSYRNSAGTHDLNFVAGSATGFQPTGGSLSNPNGIPSTTGLSSRSSINSPSTIQRIESGNENTGDASYNFSFDTGEYKRTESSDASGNVIGSFSYKNSVGGHDLSYEAGAEKGFRVIGGSLSGAPGLTDVQLGSGGFGSQIYSARTSIDNGLAVTNPVLPSGKNTYRVGNLVVNSYLPPSNEKNKFGYIFDTKY